MNKQTTITTIVLGIGLVMFCYGAVLQNKARATEEILELEAKIEELSGQIAQEGVNWWIAEDAKTECIQSWNEQQSKASENANKLREELSNAKERLGLLKQRKLQ